MKRIVMICLLLVACTTFAGDKITITSNKGASYTYTIGLDKVSDYVYYKEGIRIIYKDGSYIEHTFYNIERIQVDKS